MKREEIEKFIKQQEGVYERQYQAFQDSGDSKYASQYHRAEKLIDIARIAANAADDHSMVGTLKSELSMLANDADKLYFANDYNDPEKMRKYLHKVLSVARAYGLAR